MALETSNIGTELDSLPGECVAYVSKTLAAFALVKSDE